MLPMHSTTTLSGVGSCKSVGYETPLRQPGTERPTASKFQLSRRASWILAGSSSAGRSFVNSLQSMTIPTATVEAYTEGSGGGHSKTKELAFSPINVMAAATESCHPLEIGTLLCTEPHLFADAIFSNLLELLGHCVYRMPERLSNSDAVAAYVLLLSRHKYVLTHTPNFSVGQQVDL
jgi:hypothetical protein